MFARQASLESAEKKSAPSGHFPSRCVPFDVLPGGAVIQRKPACTCGGGCPRCQAAASGLRISEPDDQYEREADAVAEQVMRSETSEVRVSPGAPKLHRMCLNCEMEGEEEEKGEEGSVEREGTEEGEEQVLQTKAESSLSSESTDGGGSSVPPIVHDVLSSPGQPLDPEAIAFFEPRFGWDFSRVRVHSDGKAAESAKAVKAQAYTFGQDVVFGAGQYAPWSMEGRRLLAHELTHVVQQSGSPSAPATTPDTLRSLHRRPDPEAPPSFEPSLKGGRVFAAKARSGEGFGGIPLAQFPLYKGEVPPGMQTPLYAPFAIPSNTVHCVKKWNPCSAPYSPGSWAAKVTYHCPRFVPPLVLPGTKSTSYVTIPDEFTGTDPAGRDMYRCRPGFQARFKTDIGDVAATAFNRSILYPDFPSCHTGYRGILKIVLEELFKPSGGGRPAGIKVNAPPPPATIPCP